MSELEEGLQKKDGGELNHRISHPSFLGVPSESFILNCLVTWESMHGMLMVSMHVQ